MKGIKKAGIIVAALLIAVSGAYAYTALGSTEDVIQDGVYIEGVDISGMSVEDAKESIEEIAKDKASTKVSITINKDVVDTTLEELGYKWSNKSIVEEAIHIGKSGNVIKRYKDKLDLLNEGKYFAVELKLSKEDLKENLHKICEPYNIEAKNASLKATGSGFEIIPEKEGCVVDYKTSTAELYSYLTQEWDGKSEVAFTATTEVSKPKYTTEDCEKVSNIPMGSYYTSFSTGWSYDNRNMNIKNGAEKIDGTVLYPGEEFSCNECLAPWTADNGWYPAGTYVDGAVEDSLGGGICQVSSTLYNALIRAEIEIIERYPHSMSVSYVPLAADAALAGDYKDLVFKNNTDAPIYIQAIYNAAGSITFNVYGHDTRDENRTIEFVSETVSTIPIKKEIKKDSTKEKGYEEVVSTGHVGYVAKLWKIVYENGEQVSKDLVHTSSYKMTPTKIVKGTKEVEETTEEKPEKNSEDTEKKNVEKNTEESTEKKEEQVTEKETVKETVKETEAEVASESSEDATDAAE